MRFLFGDCAIDADRRELYRSGSAVHVEPQVFDLLLYLVRTRDHVVAKDEMLAAVWQGRIVSESTLNNRINAARQAIGDSGEQQRLIRTIARRGIRFVGEVREEPAHIAQAARARVAPEASASILVEQPPTSIVEPVLSLPDKPSIAVLPFTNMSDDPQQEYFADGIAEEIITALSRCGWLFVIARNSSFTYKGKAVDVRQVGRELGVRYVLEGGVRREGNRLRFTAQLIDAISGSHIWADRFEGEISNIFELQDRITESVVGAIEPKLQLAEIARLKQKPVTNLDAYDLYLRALQLEYEFSEKSLTEAIRCLERAVAIDSTYAPAMALAAYCYALRAFQAWVRDFKTEAAEAVRLANRAIELEPNDANVLWMAAFSIWFLGSDAARARELFSRSLSINPNSPMALTMSCWLDSPLGNTGKAMEQVLRAQRLSPRDPRGWMMTATMAMAHMWSGRFVESVEWAERAAAQNERLLPALRVMVVGLVQLGQREKAAAVVQRILNMDPKFTVSGWCERNPSSRYDEARWRYVVDAYRAAGVPE